MEPTMNTVAAPIDSLSITIKPQDYRCRHWAKIIRNSAPLPVPSSVTGANDIPGGYAKEGDEELFAGDFMIEGEEAHHRKARGWVYHLTFMHNGRKVIVQYFSARKDAMKAGGLPKDLLAGSGDLAGLVRIMHALRLGIDIGEFFGNPAVMTTDQEAHGHHGKSQQQRHPSAGTEFGKKRHA